MPVVALVSTMADTRTRRGNRVVVAVYLVIVAVAGVMGFVIGSIRPENLDPKFLAVVDLPPTPVGMALYGMLTIAFVLGVLLLLVRYVADRYDTDAV
jgi:ABC-type transport system involved in cytochrome c biogenesis permease subunit